jgi:hypothetical protein
MAYVLQEWTENGEPAVLGEPIHDFIVAKVIASRRAFRTQRLTVITDEATGQEVARFEPAAVPKTSVRRLRADALSSRSESDSGISVKKSG